MNISIITVCYNDIDGLVKTYHSLKKYLDKIQWIVIDGGSNDGSLSFLSGIKQSSFIYVSEKDKGIYDAI